MNVNTQSGVGCRGEYFIQVIGPDGTIKEEVHVKNVITDAYLTVVADNSTNSSPDDSPLFNYIAVGTGTTAPAITDTQMETETARKLQTSRTNDGKIASVATTFNAGDISPSTLREVGLFCGNAATTTVDTGVLVSRAAINLTVTALDAVFIDWRITYSDA